MVEPYLIERYVLAGVGITLARKCATARLLGHRSIVNHVRYSEKNKMLVSCGVEKIVKVLSCSLLTKYSTVRYTFDPCLVFANLFLSIYVLQN